VILAVIIGAVVGVGCLGVVAGLRDVPPSLEIIADAMNGTTGYSPSDGLPGGPFARVGRAALEQADAFGVRETSRWKSLLPSLAIIGESPEMLAARVFVAAAAAAAGALIIWIVAIGSGLRLSAELCVLLILVGVPVVAALPVLRVLSGAHDRRRHFRLIMGSFVDLVVLSLAGGVGVEGALFAASQITGDWAARRMARCLARAQDRGQSPWSALRELGEEIGVPELIELSTTLELAGTEGARIRQSLSARAASFRRHEQAEAESAANAMTERLFLPGALLLFGFLLFIGYPAFSRIIGGV
jgi:tight adherence protein C